jgi:carboxyl-terminal processing protease
MPKRNLIWLLVVVATAVLAVWLTRSSQRSALENRNGSASLAEACRIIQEHYYGPLDPEGFKQQALTVLVEQLEDPYSRYIPPDAARLLTSRVSGEHTGVGLILAQKPDGLYVEGVEMGSPAQKSPLAMGDRVVSIDREPAASMSVEKAREALGGPVGTVHQITFLDETRNPEPQTIDLIVEAYEVESIAGLYRNALGQWVFALDEHYAYVAVREFVEDTPRRLRQACRMEGVEGLVLDLRGNPGGLLPSAIDTADLFLDAGEIVRVVSAGDREEIHNARSSGTFPPVRMVVLIDEGSASGAELLAGALQHQRRAVVVGTRSKGKGLVQSMIPLHHDRGVLHLTTAEFFLAGRPVHRRDGNEAWGIEPDVRADCPDPEALDRMRKRLALVVNLPPGAAQRVEPGRKQEFHELLRSDSALLTAWQLLRNSQRMEQILSRNAQLHARGH